MTTKDKYNFWVGIFIVGLLVFGVIGACSNTAPEAPPSGRIDVIDSYATLGGTYKILKIDGELYVSFSRGGLTPLIKKQLEK